MLTKLHAIPIRNGTLFTLTCLCTMCLSFHCASHWYLCELCRFHQVIHCVVQIDLFLSSKDAVLCFYVGFLFFLCVCF